MIATVPIANIHIHKTAGMIIGDGAVDDGEIVTTTAIATTVNIDEPRSAIVVIGWSGATTGTTAFVCRVGYEFFTKT